MKKSDLNNSMIVQTTHNRYGFIELEKNRINICYDPDMINQNYIPDLISLDDVFEFGDGQLGVGFILTQEEKDRDPEDYILNKVGDIIIMYEFVSVFQVNKIYSNGVGPYPPLIINKENKNENS